MQKYEEHKNSYLAFPAGLGDWGPTARVITSETCTCRKQLPAVSFLVPTDFCLQAVCPWVSEGHGRAVKATPLLDCDLFCFFLWNPDLSQTPAPIVLYL